VTSTTRLAALVVALVSAPLLAQEPPGASPPQDSGFFLGQAMRALNEKVDLLLDQRKTDLAIQELRRVYTFDVAKTAPTYEIKVHLVGRLAELCAAAGRKAEAIDTVKGMLSDVAPGTPAEAAAWLEAGTVYRAVGMPDEALKAFDRAIDLSTRLAQTGWRPPHHERGRGAEQPPGERHPDGGVPPTPRQP